MTELDRLRAENAALKKQLAGIDQILMAFVGLVEASVEVMRHAVLMLADTAPSSAENANRVIRRWEEMMAAIMVARAEAVLQSAPSSEAIN